MLLPPKAAPIGTKNGFRGLSLFSYLCRSPPTKQLRCLLVCIGAVFHSMYRVIQPRRHRNTLPSGVVSNHTTCLSCAYLRRASSSRLSPARLYTKKSCPSTFHPSHGEKQHRSISCVCDDGGRSPPHGRTIDRLPRGGLPNGMMYWVKFGSNRQQEQLRGSGAPVVLDVASAGGEPAITIAKVHLYMYGIVFWSVLDRTSNTPLSNSMGVPFSSHGAPSPKNVGRFVPCLDFLISI